MFIAISFPQFFQEENRKSCCAANQNIVNGRKRNGENSARQHCSNDRQQYDRVKGISFNAFQHFQPGRGNQIDQAEILEIFKKSATKIYTLNKVYDLSSDNDFDEDFFEFGLFMSRREYKIIKRRLQRGKKQALKEGYYTHSNPPYGLMTR